MPTYEYKCRDCDHRFEVVQKMSDEPLTDCPKCSGSVKRLIGAGAGIIFKGSGFYCTDYRSADYERKAKSEKTQSSTAGGSDAGAGSSDSTKTTEAGTGVKKKTAGSAT